MLQTRAPILAIANQTVVDLVSVLVFLPSAIFATALRPLPATVMIAGCCGAMALIFARPREDRGPLAEPLQVPRLLAAIGLALVIFLLGGETHLFYPTSDWQIRDALLGDLVTQRFLAAYHADGANYLVRAPLGMYMVPAVVGRALGVAAAHRALLAQNALFLGSIFYLMMVLGRGWLHLAIIIFFGGLSIVGAQLVPTPDRPDLAPFWLRYGLDAWHPFLQYSSSVVQFFWVPNHALPGWWLATLMLLQRPSKPDVATVGLTTAGLAFWSPLAVIPAVPWLILSLKWAWRPVLTSSRTWFGAATSMGFVPVLVFMLVASSSIAHGSTIDQSDFVPFYAIFILLQLPALFFLASVRQHVPRNARDLLLVNGLILLALPLYHFGPGNDLVMRGSIASLVIVAFIFGMVVIDLARERKRISVIGWVLVALATPAAAVEIGRAVSTPTYGISDCSLMEASDAAGSKGIPSNYVAAFDQIPTWLVDLHGLYPIDVAKTACWPDRVPARFLGTSYGHLPKR